MEYFNHGYPGFLESYGEEDISCKRIIIHLQRIQKSLFLYRITSSQTQTPQRMCEFCRESMACLMLIKVPYN